MTGGLTGAEFDQLFQRFADSPSSTSVFRWEALQHYAVPHDEPSLVAFREGKPRPERSVRTSPWLARIATSTAAGKSWSRVRFVVEPQTDYLRWELVAFVESQAAGEQIRVVTGLSVTGPTDFWVFDGHDPADRHAILMHYSEEGSPIEFEYVDDQARVRQMLAQAAAFMNDSSPLNSYLAARCGVTGAA